MAIPQDWEYNFDEEISSDEYEVIEKFLASYRNQNFIVADRYRQDFSMVPLEEEKIIFKINEDTWKSIDFQRKIYHKGKPYIVELRLWRIGNMKTDPKCLSIHDFRIITDGKVHIIDLNIQNTSKRQILFNIISIFDERKIISPEQAFCKRMYTNKALQEFILNHDWAKIAEGINQNPSLANALFIIREGYTSCSHFTADFGTILYQLISFRKNNFNESDLYELDKLILKLSKTELLKVQLHEQTGKSKSWPTSSILIESNNHNSRMHRSIQYNVSNAELEEENEVLNQCIKRLKKRNFKK